MRVSVDGRSIAGALAIASALDGVVLDASGRTAADAVGRGPDGRDVLAGRATVVEACRTCGGVPVVGWGGALTPTERAILSRHIEREVGVVVVLG